MPRGRCFVFGALFSPFLFMRRAAMPLLRFRHSFLTLLNSSVSPAFRHLLFKILNIMPRCGCMLSRSVFLRFRLRPLLAVSPVLVLHCCCFASFIPYIITTSCVVIDIIVCNVMPRGRCFAFGAIFSRFRLCPDPPLRTCSAAVPSLTTSSHASTTSSSTARALPASVPVPCSLLSSPPRVSCSSSSFALSL